MYIFVINSTDAFGNRKKVEIKAETPEKALQILKDEGFRADIKDIIEAQKDSLWNKLQKFDPKSRFTQVSKKDILRLKTTQFIRLYAAQHCRSAICANYADIIRHSNLRFRLAKSAPHGLISFAP